MKKKTTYLLGGVLLAVFAGFSMASFRSALTPYVSYADARQATGRTVQVAGGLVHGSSSYDDRNGALSFTLTDPETKSQMTVRYHGVKPANFEDAISIVAIGRYDAPGGVFQAEKLLVKCPSKYQGAEVKEYS